MEELGGLDLIITQLGMDQMGMEAEMEMEVEMEMAMEEVEEKDLLEE